jgi:hypothetical protein
MVILSADTAGYASRVLKGPLAEEARGDRRIYSLRDAHERQLDAIEEGRPMKGFQ